VRIQPVAVANADRAAALGAATDEHILAGPRLAIDKDHRAANVANRHGGGGAKAVNHHLVIVRCLIDFAVGNERRGKFGRGSDTVVRFGIAVPDGLKRALPTVETSYARRTLGVEAMFESGSLGRLPAASLAHRIAFEVPFGDRDKMPPGIPPGDESNRCDSGAVSHGISGEVSATFGEHAHRVVLALNKQRLLK
jgi:hypothetical protein